MMRKTLIIVFLFLFFSANAQFIQNAPWMENINIESKTTSITFQKIVDAANTYWETHDKDAKGSGYKPFKRWENHWKNYVNKDGYLPTSADLWNAWSQKNAKALSSRNNFTDVSDWVSLGPTHFTNKDFSVANIGRINAIIVDPNNSNIYYAGAPSGGIWKSTDAGLSWTPLSDKLPQIGVSGIAIDYNNSNIIYIATGDDDASDTVSAGVFKSIDGGATWQQNRFKSIKHS